MKADTDMQSVVTTLLSFPFRLKVTSSVIAQHVTCIFDCCDSEGWSSSICELDLWHYKAVLDTRVVKANLCGSYRLAFILFFAKIRGESEFGIGIF